MTARNVVALCLTVALGAGAGLGCSSRSQEKTEPAAEVNGKTVTVGQLDDYIKDQLFRQATDNLDPVKLHEVRQEALEGLIDTQLVDAEAASRGETRQQLLEQEAQVRSKVPESAIKEFYEQHKPQMGNIPYESLHDQIERVLERQQRRTASEEFVSSLRKKADVKVLLKQPRVDVAAVGPSEGPADAPVTIIEFSDFQCPYCRHVEPTIDELMKQYKGKVRLVYRHFPLETVHPLAMGAAEASVCAEDQGRFWDYHDRLFAKDAKLDSEGLEAIAKDLGLDVSKWQVCLKAKSTQEKIASDVKAGREAGVTGTPAFFVNGIPLRGALPLSDFTNVVNDELAKAGAEAKPKSAG